MTQHLSRTLAAGLVLLALAAQTALAKDKADEAAPAGQDNSGYGGSYRYFGDGPPIDARLYATANARSAGTAAQLAAASSAVNVIPVVLRINLESSAEFRAAITALKDSQDVYEATRRKVLAALEQSDSDYRSALREQESLGRILAAGNLSPKDRLDLAVRKLAYATEATKLATEALDADAPTKEARGKMLAAANKVAEMRIAQDQAIRSDPNFLAARKALDAARVESAAADAYLAGLDIAYGEILDFYYYREWQRRFGSRSIDWGYLNNGLYGNGYGYANGYSWWR